MQRKKIFHILIVAMLAATPCIYLALRQPPGAVRPFMLLMGSGSVLMFVYYAGVYAAIQEVIEPATMLSLVSCGLALAFVSEATRWRCPTGVVLLSVEDLSLPLPMPLIWRKDNTSSLLARFLAGVQLLPEVKALKPSTPASRRGTTS